MNGAEGLTRRELLELGALTGLVGVTPAIAMGGPVPGQPAARARNVVFMVSDGMSIAVPALAEVFSRQVRGRGTHWYGLLTQPGVVHGLFETHSLSSLVTDSAAASTAWGSGSRVFNGAVNVLPDGTPLTPLAPLVRDSGRRVGLVTTTTITHATPAGFAATVKSRDDQATIATQYLGRVDVLLGGGSEYFSAEQRPDGRDLRGEFAAAGYACLATRAELLRVGGSARLLGTFGAGHLPYTLDQRNTPELAARVPTLVEMTRAALAALSPAEGGFLLQVEGGRVDHAAHNNDIAALLWDQLAFDDALGEVLEFARARSDTLVIVTSDHGNSNPGLNGMGDEYRDSPACFARIAGASMSFDRLTARLAELASEPGAEEGVAALLRRATGLEPSAAEVRLLCAAGGGTLPPALNRQHANLVGVLGAVLANYYGVGWTGVSHTSDPVLLTATGPGADRFAGLHPLTDAFAALTELLDIRHRNPSMTPEAARAFAADAPRLRQPHWVAV